MKTDYLYLNISSVLTHYSLTHQCNYVGRATVSFFPVRANRLLGFLLRYKLHKKNSQINQIKRTKFPLKHLWSGSSGREGFVTSSLADLNSCIKSTDQEGLTFKRILTQNRFSQRERKKSNKKGLWKVLVFECHAIFNSPQNLHNQQLWREK